MDEMRSLIRDSVVCSACGLNQFVTANLQCRRCHKLLDVTYIEIRIPSSGFLRQTGNRLPVGQFIGRVLRGLRRANRMTQSVLAASAGIDRSNISRAERGTAVPSLPALLGTAAAFGIDKVFLRVRDPSHPSYDSGVPTSTEGP